MVRETYTHAMKYDSDPVFGKSYILPEQGYSEEFSAGSVTRWFHVLPYGSIVRRGITRTHDTETMESILDSYSRHGMPLTIDWNHQSMRAEAGNGPLRTAGIVVGLGLKSDGLWAMGKFNKEAQEIVKAGHIHYCSPVIEYGAEDSLTGKPVKASLYNVALATNPALTGLKPIQFSKDSNMPLPEEKKAAPEEPPTAPEAPAISPDATAALQLLCEQVGCKSVNDLIPLLEKNMERVASVLKGGDAVATASFCNDAEKGKVSMTADTRDTQIELMTGQIDALTKELAIIKTEREAFAKKAFDAKLNEKIDTLYKEGKLLKEQETPARELFSKDWTLGERMFEKITVPMKPQAGPDPQTKLTKETLNPKQTELYSALRQSTVYARATEQELIDEVTRLEKEGAK